MGEERHVANKSVKVPAEALGWSLLPGYGGCPVCPRTNIQPETRSQGACQIIHHVSWEHLSLDEVLLRAVPEK